MSRGSRPAPFSVALLFFASGAAALVVETTWLRWFRLLFGATAPATAATLVAFLVGQAGGAALAAKRLPRARNPLAIYAALEIGAGLWALAVPLLLGLGESLSAAVYDELRQSPAALASLRFAIALLATLPASLCLGATLPAVGAALLPGPRALGTGGSGLYALNLLGAAFGTAIAAFWLADRIGVLQSYATGAALHLTVGAAAFALSRVSGPPAPVPEEAPALTPARPSSALADPALVALAALSGFGSFAAQVLLVQSFGLVLNQSIYAFGAVLVTVLISLAAGACGVAWTLRRRVVAPVRLLGAALAASALGLALFPVWLHAVTDGLGYVGSPAAGSGYAFAAIRTALVAAGPALLCAAGVFPSLFAVAGAADRPVAALLGRLVAANTAGAILGAVSAPFVLLPALGAWKAFLALALPYAAAAMLLPDPSVRGRRVRVGALLVAGSVLMIAANPARLPLVPAVRGERVLSQTSGAEGVVTVLERGGERLIRTDHHYSLGGTGERVHEERQGHLPLLLHPAPERVAFVGTATGITAGAAVPHPVAQITLVEIVPRVAGDAARYFVDANRGVHRDPRARIVLDDARNFFRATRNRFDVIVADLFVPWRAGTGSLFSLEHFASVRARLRPDGLFCQWLPLYQLTELQLLTITATFLDVFPRSALFRGDFFGAFPIAALVGFAGEPATAQQVSRAAERLAAAGVSDRWVTDPVGIWSLYTGPLAPLAPQLAGIPRNTDDRPRIEYLAAGAHAGAGPGVVDPVIGLRWDRFDRSLHEAAMAAEDPIYPRLPEAARRASLGGAQLLAAGGLWVAGRVDESARALAAAAELIPRHLLADAPADPTAAEVWWPER